MAGALAAICVCGLMRLERGGERERERERKGSREGPQGSQESRRAKARLCLQVSDDQGVLLRDRPEAKLPQTPPTIEQRLRSSDDVEPAQNVVLLRNRQLRFDPLAQLIDEKYINPDTQVAASAPAIRAPRLQDPPIFEHAQKTLSWAHAERPFVAHNTIGKAGAEEMGIVFCWMVVPILEIFLYQV